MSNSPYDMIIIGTGAGGGTLARRLAPSGKRILVLERGGFLPREEDNWSTRSVFTESKYKAKEAWLDKSGAEFHPGMHYWVGGNTKVYGAALLRFRSRDFEELRHRGGISPAWPIRYEDLAPYYGTAEKIYHVHGQRGIDPTEPPGAGPYPYPALPHEPRIQELYDDLTRMGYHPFPLPIGVRLDQDPAVPQAQVVLGHFDGYPDPTESKADAHVCGIKPALKSPNLTLWTGAYVDKLIADGRGKRVEKVRVLRNGTAEEVAADIVVVACGAVNSTALLLRSASDQHPHGLANSSGVVGRHYMCHNNSAMIAVSKHPNPTRFGKTWGLNDFHFGDRDWDYPLGHIQMLGKSDAEIFRADAPAIAPGKALEFMARHCLDFWMTSEDLPDPENRVSLDRDGRITLSYTENNVESHNRLKARLKSMLKHLKCEEHLGHLSLYMGKKIPLAGTAHQCGTVRFGRDPKTSALDIHCKAHDLDNLYVVDGSFFVSSSAVNPALTIMANALRVGDHLLERLA